MRHSIIINSNANVDRLCGRGGDQLVASASRQKSWQLQTGRGTYRCGKNTGLLPLSVTTNLGGEVEQVVQPSVIVPPQFSPCFMPAAAPLTGIC